MFLSYLFLITVFHIYMHISNSKSNINYATAFFKLSPIIVFTFAYTVISSSMYIFHTLNIKIIAGVRSFLIYFCPIIVNTSIHIVYTVNVTTICSFFFYIYTRYSQSKVCYLKRCSSQGIFMAPFQNEQFGCLENFNWVSIFTGLNLTSWHLLLLLPDIRVMCWAANGVNTSCLFITYVRLETPIFILSIYL